jgi:hypothetical protein
LNLERFWDLFYWIWTWDSKDMNFRSWKHFWKFEKALLVSGLASCITGPVIGCCWAAARALNQSGLLAQSLAVWPARERETACVGSRPKASWRVWLKGRTGWAWPTGPYRFGGLFWQENRAPLALAQPTVARGANAGEVVATVPGVVLGETFVEAAGFYLAQEIVGPSWDSKIAAERWFGSRGGAVSGSPERTDGTTTAPESLFRAEGAMWQVNLEVAQGFDGSMVETVARLELGGK